MLGVALVGGLIVFWLQSIRPKPLPVFGVLPPFQLLERSGETVRSADLRSHLWVADFFFSACPGPCLLMNKQMEALHRTLPKDVRCVSITVDPKADQPPSLRRYAEKFGVADDDAGWLFLTGKQETIYRLAREGFHLAASGPEVSDLEEQDRTPLVAYIHSTRFALVDVDGRVRGIYDSTNPEEVRRLVSDIQALR